MKSIIKIILPVLSLFLLSLSTAEATVGIINGLTHEKKARGGETYEKTIIVKNFGQKEVRIKIYQTDFYFYSDGRIFYGEAGKLVRSNANWITFYPKRLVIAPQNTAEVKCVVKVPENEDLRGTYWSMLMVEPVPVISHENLVNEKEKVRFGVDQIIRYGVQIVTHISDTGTREIKFLKTEILREKGKKILMVDIENVGERWLRPYLYVELYDERGGHAGKFEGRRMRIYPETSVRYQVDLSNVPEGLYKAMIIVDNKDEYVFGAEYSFVLNSEE